MTIRAMAFAPSVYGELASTVLNTLAERYDLRGEKGVYCNVQHNTMTEPEGTLLEADILLSCSHIGRSALIQTLRYVDPEDELFGVSDREMHCFFRDPAQYEAVVEKFYEPHGRAAKIKVLDAKKSIISTVLECRRSIRQIPVPKMSPGPVFSDGLFGPHVAKVMNSLLEAEIECTENYGVYESFPPSKRHLEKFWRDENRRQRALVSLVQSDAQSQEHRSFAPGKGTAFAGDMLVRVHSITSNHDKIEGGSVTARKIREALFPVFQYSPSGVETPDICFRKAFQNVREEMDFVHRIVHGQVLPFLMAAAPRLGRESPLRDVDVEVMRIIAHFVIFGP
jgi:hypothetical protein